MKIRYLTAACAAVILGVAASTASGGNATPEAAQKITVWLMVDAQTSWPQAVAAANRAFAAQHPGVEVEVQYQQWSDILTKFDAALAGRNTPDVIELGNTQTTKYMAEGALRQLTKANYPNSSTWLQGLAASCTYNGRTFCVPYYAGARAVIYRKDYYRAAGVAKTPTTLAEFRAAGSKLMRRYGRNRNFSALYFPGKYWYAGMSFVYDYGGQIAVRRNGRWQGALNSRQAIRGLTVLKSTVGSLSRANKTGDEAHPQQALVFSKGNVASFIGNGWEWPYALDPKLGNPSLKARMGAYPMPSHTRGKYMPTFLGGSDLAIPIFSENIGLARDWIRAFTSTSSQRTLATQGKVIPNTTTLAGINANNPQLAPFAKAAKYSWFVPTSPNWANVESANVLPNMLSAIITGRRTVTQAANSANAQITQILNRSS